MPNTLPRPAAFALTLAAAAATLLPVLAPAARAAEAVAAADAIYAGNDPVAANAPDAPDAVSAANAANAADAVGSVDADGNFPAGLWSLTLTGSYMNELGPHDQEYVGGAVGVHYYVLENLSLGAEFGGWGINQPGNDGAAWSAGVGLRHHLVTWANGSVFFDVGEYAMQADTDVPDDGTSFNYLFLCGGGLSYRVADNVHLIAGARYFHLSNAGREGGDTNPSNNGVQGFAGLMFTF